MLHGPALLVFLALGACAPNNVKLVDALGPVGGGAKIVLMPLDVELSELRASGAAEVNAQWTRDAESHLATALDAFLAERNAVYADYSEPADGGRRSAIQTQVRKLYPVVGQAIFTHKAAPVPVSLPTKEDSFDYTLGPGIRELVGDEDADYGLFIFIRDSYTTNGRLALIATGALLGISLPAGSQVGHATLVDLNSGDVVWFNALFRGSGDLRNGPAARRTLNRLLENFPG